MRAAKANQRMSPEAIAKMVATKLAKRTVGYNARHRRVELMRGRASARACIDCGLGRGPRRKMHWSHRHNTDPFEVANYDPRCEPCHKRYDA